MAAQLEDAHADKSAASRRTLQLITVLVPAIAGVLGTCITVLPQLRSKNVTISDLMHKLERLEQRNIQNNLVSESQGRAAAETVKRLKITGTVTDSSGKPLSWAEVLFVPQNKPKLIGNTDADGSFNFPDMPDQRYRIVVRDSSSGKITLGELDEDRPVTRLDGAIEALVRYHVEK